MPKQYNINDYTIEHCPWCDSEQVYGCDGSAKDEQKPITNRAITREEQQLYQYL